MFGNRLAMSFSLIRLLVLTLSIQGISAYAVTIAPSRYYISAQSKTAFIPYKASHSIKQGSKNIERIIISIHSSSYDANQYYKNAYQAAKKQGVVDKTLIIAPHFLHRKKIPTAHIPNQMLYWRVYPFWGSSKGAIGSAKNKISISTFDVLDTLLKDLTLSQRFPNLKDIVLVGHSAGGQLVQRYAMVGKFEPSPRHRIRYVVSAPSSYAYPTHKRIDTSGKLTVLKHANCKKYNNWGNGLQKPYKYAKNISPALMQSRYAKRRVFYLVCSRDNAPHHKSLSKKCAARLQGAHRVQRMHRFSNMLDIYYGASVKRKHTFYTVPNIGHSGKKVMLSKQGLSAMFGR